MGFLNIFSSTYSQLVYTYSKGNKTIIYDVNAAEMTKTIFIIVAVFLFIVFTVSIVFYKTKKINTRALSPCVKQFIIRKQNKLSAFPRSLSPRPEESIRQEIRKEW